LFVRFISCLQSKREQSLSLLLLISDGSRYRLMIMCMARRAITIMLRSILIKLVTRPRLSEKLKLLSKVL
jgi:hypothetical protein